MSDTIPHTLTVCAAAHWPSTSSTWSGVSSSSPTAWAILTMLERFCAGGGGVQYTVECHNTSPLSPCPCTVTLTVVGGDCGWRGLWLEGTVAVITVHSTM